MIVYNVTITVDPDVATDWLKWLQDEHAQEVLDTECFHKYEIYRILDHQQTEAPTYAIKYYTESMQKYEEYIENHAETLRNKGFEAFGDKFIAFRTLMQKV